MQSTYKEILVPDYINGDKTTKDMVIVYGPAIPTNFAPIDAIVPNIAYKDIYKDIYNENSVELNIANTKRQREFINSIKEAIEADFIKIGDRIKIIIDIIY